MNAHTLKTGLLGLLLFCLGMGLTAQTGDQANVESIRIGFLTKRLNLTPEEAQQFWPIYNQYQNELTGLKQAQKESNRDTRRNFDVMSDQEVEEAVEGILQTKQQELDLFMRYHEQFKTILPIRKVAKLYKSEQEFTRLLLNRLNQRQQTGARQRSRARQGGRLR